MSDPTEEYQVLISGYLDGELEAEEREKVEGLMESSPAFRREYESMKRLFVGTASAFRIEEPSEETWDTFLDSVYNRLERQSGWIVLILGAVTLAAYGVVLYWVMPWASLPLKVLLALPAVGLVLLFISVLRQRLRVAKTDRYSREVFR